MKILHRCQENGVFVCGEEFCNRHFPTLKTFRKHITKHCLEEHTSTVFPTDDTKNHTECFLNDVPTNRNIDSSQSDPINNSDQKLTRTFETNFKQFQSKLIQNNVSFMCTLYGESNLCRKDIQNIMSNVSQLISDPLAILKDFIMTSTCDSYSVSYQDRLKIQKYFEEFENMFNGFKTEYQRFNYLEKLGYYIPPLQYVLGQRLEKISNSNVTPKNYTAEFISLTNVLKNFLLLPNVFSKTLKYMKHLQGQKQIYNIIQTDFWKNKISNYHKNDIVLPLFIYYDDFESGNPLGSHAGIHKIGAVYFSIACLPPKYESHLENIFLALLFHASDIKEFGEALIFSKLVEEINVLQTDGITLDFGSEIKQVYFCLALFLGDNLGLNTILGFQQSFTATSFCRFCKICRPETQRLCHEVSDSLRNKENYIEDLNTANPSITGIKFSPFINSIKYFHVTENYCIDIAHDIYEGVGVFIMGYILYQFVFIDKFFDLDTLNENIAFFNFNSNHNKPPLISSEQLKKKMLKMSASEMKCFILNSGLLFGYLIPVSNEHWNLYILLRKILHIVLSKYVDVSTMSIELSQLVNDLNSSFLNLSSLTLKPKFHLLTHYPLIMKKIGPLLQTCTLRFEAKHRQLKLAANVVSSRINITHTLAIKHQLQSASRFAMQTGFMDDIIFTSDNNSVCITDIIPDMKKILSNADKQKLENFQSNVKLASKFSVGSKIFRLNDILLIDYNDMPCFAKINKIIVDNNSKLCLICEKLITNELNGHLFSYEVEFTPELVIILFEDIYSVDTYNVIIRNGKKYITIY